MYPPPVNEETCIDNLDVRWGNNQLFKSGATRQKFDDLRILGPKWGHYTGYQISWDEYLFIQDLDEDIRVLSTRDPAGVHHPLVRLWNGYGTAGKNEDVLMGCFDLRFEFVAVKGPPIP